VGQRKSWILQYCLPQSAAQEIPLNDKAALLEAPWPFLMTRPENRSLSDDSVLVRGVVTAQGRFDQLILIYPRELALSELLINSLKLWEFRPATLGGQSTAVEVLLIIPR
jgi:hypothetical protein